MSSLVANDVLLDGLVGSLIGSSVTLLVVVATIRHENKARRADTLDTAIAAAYATAMNHAMAAQVEGPESKRSIESVQPMLQTLTLAMSRARAIEPELADFLQVASEDMTRSMTGYTRSKEARDAYVKCMLRLQTAIGRWVADPELIRHRRLTYHHIRQLADGTTASDLDIERPNLWDRLRRGIRRRC